MKIAFFTDTYLPNTDGVVTYILSYRRALESMGHEVYVFAPGTKKQKDDNRDPRVHYFSSTTFKPYPDYKVALFPFITATNMIKEIKPDIVHSHGIATTGIAAFQAAHKIGVPAIASFHTMVSEGMHYITKKEDFQKIFESVAWKYLGWYYSNFDRVIVPSNFSRAILERQGIKNLVVKPAGLDLKSFHPKVECEFVRKKYSLDGPMVLFVGRLVVEKNLALLVDAAQKVVNKMPNVKFVIAGKGPAEQYYKDLVKSAGLTSNFVFAGFVQGSELPALYRAADVFAFPSFFDTQGLVVLEAMATGTPAVVPKDSAPAEFVTDGESGYYFSDAQDFSEKLLLAIENKGKLSKGAIAEARKHEIEACAKDLMEFYEAMLKSKAKPESKG
jgi:1,2-diacylglycerol 3-alpha-glucosyltransferase